MQNQQLELLDGHKRTLGRVIIEQVQGDLMFGRFTPTQEFARVERLFADFLEAANEQLLSVVADLDREIASLGLSLRGADGDDVGPVVDVQIGEGTINFRLPSPEQASSGRTSAAVSPAPSTPPHDPRPV
jgi:hypothetical protein